MVVLKQLVEVVGLKSEPVKNVTIQHMRFEQTKHTNDFIKFPIYIRHQ